MQQTIDDPVKLKAYLMKSSMIDGLRRAAAAENGAYAHAATADNGLMHRIEVVEQGLARQERAFHRLVEMMSALVEQPR